MTRRALEHSECASMQRSTRRSIFRMEALNEYRVPDEEATFRAYLAGETFQPTDDDRQWWDKLKDERQAGKHRQRVHIVDMPLSDYVKYEIDTGYAYSGPAGEEIRMIDRRTAHSAGIPSEDFLLLDEQTLIFIRYDDGSFVAYELEDDNDIIQQYVDYKNTALELATPFDEFRTGSELDRNSGLAS